MLLIKVLNKRHRLVIIEFFTHQFIIISYTSIRDIKITFFAISKHTTISIIPYNNKDIKNPLLYINEGY